MSNMPYEEDGMWLFVFAANEHSGWFCDHKDCRSKSKLTSLPRWYRLTRPPKRIIDAYWARAWCHLHGQRRQGWPQDEHAHDDEYMLLPAGQWPCRFCRAPAQKGTEACEEHRLKAAMC